MPMSAESDASATAGAEVVNLVTTDLERGPALKPWSIPPAPERLVIRLALVLMFAIVGTVLTVGGAAILQFSLELMQSSAPAGAR